MKEYSYKTHMFSKAVSEFGRAWLNLAKASSLYGITMEELKAKDKMDESIKDFILICQKRVVLVTKKMREEREEREKRDD